MTRKDYVAIAKAFQYSYLKITPDSDDADCAHRNVWHVLRMDIANALADDNPRFDRQRFYTACEGK
jgi:hypothetical protein